MRDSVCVAGLRGVWCAAYGRTHTVCRLACVTDHVMDTRAVCVAGFIVHNRLILTNAHVVADSTYVLVKRHGSGTKYRAGEQLLVFPRVESPGNSKTWVDRLCGDRPCVGHSSQHLMHTRVNMHRSRGKVSVHWLVP